MEALGVFCFCVFTGAIVWMATYAYCQVKYNEVVEDWTKTATEQMDFVHRLCMVYSEPDKWQKNIRHTLINGHNMVEVARLSWMGLTEDQKQAILRLTALKE